MSEAEERVVRNFAKIIAYGYGLSIHGGGRDKRDRARLYAAVRADEFIEDAKFYLEGKKDGQT